MEKGNERSKGYKKKLSNIRMTILCSHGAILTSPSQCLRLTLLASKLPKNCFELTLEMIPRKATTPWSMRVYQYNYNLFRGP